MDIDRVYVGGELSFLYWILQLPTQLIWLSLRSKLAASSELLKLKLSGVGGTPEQFI